MTNGLGTEQAHRMMDLFGAEDVHIQNKQKQPCRTTEIEQLRKQRARTYQKAKNREISKQTISKLQLHKNLAPPGGQWQRPQGGARCLLSTYPHSDCMWKLVA